MSARAIAKPVDLGTPLYAGSGFLIGVAGVNPIGWGAAQLVFKIFSGTLQGRGQSESVVNAAIDVGSSFFAYLWGQQVRSQLRLEQDVEETVESKPTYLSPPAGYRRARQDEVTPQISAAAKNGLSSPMGTLLGPYVNENGVSYYVAIETHSNKPKGASVFVQA
jgi:hypothetical protein